jgi:hypothetical protein
MSNHSTFAYILAAVCGAVVGGVACFLVLMLVVLVCSAAMSSHGSLDQAGWALIGLVAAMFIGIGGGAVVGVLWLRRRDKGP